jgi:hypothetical protein
VVRIGNRFFPTLKPGKYGKASTGVPSTESSRQDKKKGVLVNTPTLTWAYTWTFKEREKKI